MAQCQALANRYIGKGKDRKQYSGTCVLEHGHDSDHLPYDLAMEQVNARVFNEALEQVLAQVGFILGSEEIAPEVMAKVIEQVSKLHKEIPG